MLKNNILFHTKMQTHDTCHLYAQNYFTLAYYSLHPKMIVLLPGFLCSKMIVRLSGQLEIEAQSQIFLHQTFYMKKSFETTTSGGVWK